MNSFNEIIFLAIPFPSDIGPFDREEDFDKFYLIQKELADLSGCLSIPLFGRNETHLQFLWLQDDSLIKQIEDKYQVPFNNDWQYLAIYCDNPCDPDLLIKYLTDLVVLINICYPGIIGIKDSWHMRNGVVEHIYPLGKLDTMSIQFAVLYARKLDWPRLEDIKIVDAWEWYMHQEDYLEQEGFENDICTRAMNAYARMLDLPENDVYMQIVWSMIGIETLYKRGRNNGKRQFVENVPKILGQYDGFEKEFDLMYEFRSRFIHGGVDFPGLCLLGDANLKYGQIDSDQERTLSFAASILIASLQQIIKGNWRVVLFPKEPKS
jgi:hypothetical protein